MYALTRNLLTRDEVGSELIEALGIKPEDFVQAGPDAPSRR
jgi:hypothetical protein